MCLWCIWGWPCGRGPQRGGMAPQQYRAPQEYYPGRDQPRGGGPSQPRRGGRGGGSSYTAPSYTNQFSRCTKQFRFHIKLPQPMVSEKSSEKIYEGGSSSQKQPGPSQVTKSMEKLSIHEEHIGQQMQPASSKALRFPLRTGKGVSGIRCIAKANHFFAELPDKDLHQYDKFELLGSSIPMDPE